MGIFSKVGAYLEANRIQFDTIPPANIKNTVLAPRLSPKTLAKAVVLEDHSHHYLMAILPAGKQIKLHALEEELNLGLRFVKDEQLYEAFKGDISSEVINPVVYQAHNLIGIYDEVLSYLSDVYIEGGDGEPLIHLSKNEFHKLMADMTLVHFNSDIYH